MRPPSLTSSQRTSRDPTPNLLSSTQPSFLQQLHGSGLFDLLLQPRGQLYGSIEGQRQARLDARTPKFSESEATTPEKRADYIEGAPDRLPTPSDDFFEDHESSSSYEIDMLQYSKMASKASTPVSRRRGRPKKNAAKGKKKIGNEEKSKKRPASRRSESSSSRATKVQKKDETDDAVSIKKEKPHEEANTKKKIEAPTTMKKIALDVIDLVSDDDDDDDDTPLSLRAKGQVAEKDTQLAPVERKGIFSGFISSWTKSKGNSSKDSEAGGTSVTRPSEHLQNNWTFGNVNKTDSPSDDDSGLTPTGCIFSNSAIDTSPSSVPSNGNGNGRPGNLGMEVQLRKCQVDLEAQTKRTQTLDDELGRLKREHGDEIQKLREDYAARERKATDLFDECQVRIERQQTDFERAEHRHKDDLEKLNQKLTIAEVENSRLEATVDKLENTSKKPSSASGTELEVENAALKAALKREKQEHEELMKSLDDQDLTADVESSSTKAASDYRVSELQVTNAALVKELEAIKEREKKWSTLSPAPSSLSSASSTDEQTKIQNVRNTYIKVKRRYDNLHSVAVNLNTCTRQMDLSSFGEFGQYLRQLKLALDEKQDDDSQRSSQGSSQRRGLSAASRANDWTTD